MWRFALALALALLASLLLSPRPASAEKAPFLADSLVDALAEEISGASALRHLEALARQHRMRGSAGYHNAATHIVETLRG